VYIVVVPSPTNAWLSATILICEEAETTPDGNPLGCTYDALVAKLALAILPKNDPLNDPVTFVAVFISAETNIVDEDGGAEVNTTLFPDIVKSSGALNLNPSTVTINDFAG